jgi:hypothetical protein
LLAVPQCRVEDLDPAHWKLLRRCPAGTPIPFDGGRMRRRGRVSARSPLDGEENEKRKRERGRQAVRSARRHCPLHLWPVCLPPPALSSFTK